MYDPMSLSFLFVGLCYFLPCRRQSAYSRHEPDAESPDDQHSSHESDSRSILSVMGINERRWDSAAHQRRRDQRCDVMFADSPPAYSSLDLPPSYSAVLLGATAGATISSYGAAAAHMPSHRVGRGVGEVSDHLYVGSPEFLCPPPFPDEDGDDYIAGRSGRRAALSSMVRAISASRVTPLDASKLIASPPPAYDDIMGNA